MSTYEAIMMMFAFGTFLIRFIRLTVSLLKSLSKIDK